MVCLLKAFLGRLKAYCDSSSIHGLRYITEERRHPSERILWTVVCASAVYASYRLIMVALYNFQHNAVSFVVETTYLDWNTTFPAISICENEAPDKLFEYGEKLYGKDRDMNMDLYLRDISFFEGSCSTCGTQCGVSINCTRDFDRILNEIRSPCDKLIDACSWNDKPFHCCSHFSPMVTEMGTCFTVNSLHHRNRYGDLQMISNRKTGPGRIKFNLYDKASIYIHAPEDVPYINHPQAEKAVLNWGTVLNMIFQVNEIDNDPTLRKEVSVQQRNCRFPDENTIPIYDYYSYSTCVVHCRAEAQVQYCNCTHHFMPKLPGVETCSIRGLACLTNYSETLRALRSPYSDKKGLVCDCMPSCVEPEYTIVLSQQSPNVDYNDENYGSRISIAMDTLPSERFKRNVVRTRMDLVVSIGGTLGLCLGASLLSTVEFIYFIFIRKSVTKKSSDKINAVRITTDKHQKRNLNPSKFIRVNGSRNLTTRAQVHPYRY